MPRVKEFVQICWPLPSYIQIARVKNYPLTTQVILWCGKDWSSRSNCFPGFHFLSCQLPAHSPGRASCWFLVAPPPLLATSVFSFHPQPVATTAALVSTLSVSNLIQNQDILKYLMPRSLGALRALFSSWRPLTLSFAPLGR